MTRVFYGRKDYQLRLDPSSPVHYDILLQGREPGGSEWDSVYRIYGLDRRGTRIVFERRWPHTSAEALDRPSKANWFIFTYARPLRALPGRIELEESKEGADPGEYYTLDCYDHSLEADGS
ncbi:MAG: hypothetical protein OK436_07600 [Thaumarchaeota archaeon]|nr:hypothetical protein [Nitrososphaerota archaeon]